MAKMRTGEAIARARLLLEDATAELAKVTSRNRARQIAIVEELTRAAQVRLASLTAEPLAGKGIRLPNIPRYSTSLARGFAILDLFPPTRNDLLGIADIAQRLNMSRSTAHRYVITLVALGQLEQPEGTQRYRRVQIQ